MDRNTILAVSALVGVFVLLVRQNNMAKELSAIAKPSAGITITQATPVAVGHVEVAHHMARIQQHAEKLWWAGQAENLELAKFYRHEIKEEMEAVADGSIVDDGIPVSDHMKTYGIRAIDAFKEQLATDGLNDFNDRYEALILSCNSCHRVTGKPQLVMRIPIENRFSGQDFSVHK